MSNLYRRAPQRVLWGEGIVDRLPSELAREQARRAVIVCGSSVASHPQLVPYASDLLGDSLVGVSADARAHSPVDCVESVADLLTTARADSVVVIGGGSALVTARAACILLGEDRTLEHLSTRLMADGTVDSPRLRAPKLPIIAVPTTPTTATNKAGAAVTSDGQRQRLALYDPKTRARSILLDPDYLASSPAGLYRDASLTALVMAVEGLCAERSHPFSDATLMHAIRELARVLPAMAGSTISPHDRMDAALAGLLVGEGTDATGGGVTAALSHTIGHQYEAHNGAIDALLLPHVLDRVPPGQHAARRVASALGCELPRLTSSLRELVETVGSPTRLRDCGIPRDSLDQLAHAAMSDFAYASGRRRLEPDTLSAILHDAW